MSSPMPLTVMFVLAVFAASGGIVWLARGDGGNVVGEPPLIRASATPLKQNPDDPGGRRVADLGGVGDLLASNPNQIGEERLLPSPEQPLRPEQAASPGLGADGYADERGRSTAALDALLSELRPDGSGGSGAGGPPPSARLPSAPRPEWPTDGVAEPPMERTTLRAERAVLSDSNQSANAVLEELSLAAANSGRVPQGQEAAAPPGGQFRVQLAAVREEEDARRAWALFEDQLGPYVQDLQPFFEVANTKNGIFYRIQVGPFPSDAAAGALCAELQKKDASCFVVER